MASASHPAMKSPEFPESSASALVKADEATELSLIRVSPPADVPFPHFEIRESASVELGEVVITVANSFHSATRAGELTTSVGLMSGRYEVTRSLAEQPVYLGEVVETTAATNPGSDGGPLLDGSGRVIGVLSLNVSDARWLGVAVPIEVMLDDLRTAIRNDLEQRGQEVPEELLPTVMSAGAPIFPEWEERSTTFRNAVRSVQDSVVAIQIDKSGGRDDLVSNSLGPARKCFARVIPHVELPVPRAYHNLEAPVACQVGQGRGGFDGVDVPTGWVGCRGGQSGRGPLRASRKTRACAAR